MASIPVPRSFNQIESDLIDAFLSRTGLKALKVGSPLLSIFEATAQSDLRSSQDIFSLLDASSLDSAESDSLDKIGADEEIYRIQESASSGYVNISDSSFNKISTRIFQGTSAPIIGTIILNIVDASNFPSSGNIYIGRNTSNYEGPIAYGTKTNNGIYWSLTLITPTLRFHNLNEDVVLAQGGDRFIGAGQLVQTPQGNTSDAVQFSTLYASTIPDGETRIVNVPVVAQTSGIIGNVPAGAINSFVSSPFTGADVTNPLPFTNATATETDDAYRERIKLGKQARTKGTALALKSYTIGVRSSEDNKQVTSASVVTRENFPAVLYIDDGTGYEEQDVGIAIESLQDLAIGGEQYFQTTQKPIAKAFVESLFTAPYVLTNGSKLAFAVNGVVSEHTFNLEEFNAINNASAYEVSASINANINLTWSARTISSGTQLAIFAKTDTNEDIEWVKASAIDSNTAFGFPTGRVDTMRLYKNDILLSKDGKRAVIQGSSFGLWNLILGPQTLIISIDHTPSVTYTFTDADFVNAKTGFNVVGANTIAAWVLVINAKISGITAFSNLGSINLISNLGANARAAIQIIGGTLVTNNMFKVSSSFGVDDQYTLDRNLGQVRLFSPLAINDKLSIGTKSTRAFLESTILGPTTLTNIAYLWMAIDANHQVVKTGANVAAILTLSIPDVKIWGYRLRITTTPGSFSDVQVGDTLVLWDSAFDLSLRNFAFRITGIDPTLGAYVEIDVNSMKFARVGHTLTKLLDGRVLVVGGNVSANDSGATNSVEIFDPMTNTWSNAASMHQPRAYHTATLLTSGKVLVFGGVSAPGDVHVLAAGEIYDPIGNTWAFTSTTNAPAPCYFHTSNPLAANKAIVIGGRLSTGFETNTCFIYDGTADTWIATGNMNSSRAHHTSEVLNTGNILAIMGEALGSVLGDAEVYDVIAGTWAFTTNAPQAGRQSHASSILNDNTVLVTGGSTNSFNALASPVALVDIYSPGTDLWSIGTTLNDSRAFHTQSTNLNGDAIVGFGFHTDPLKTVELYDEIAMTWTVQPNPPESFIRISPKSVSLTNQVLFVGGQSILGTSTLSISSAEIFQKITPHWIQPFPSLLSPIITLVNGGLDVSRLNGLLTKLTVPNATNYTANSFTDQLNLPINLDNSYRGATSLTYRTIKIRAITNTFNLSTGSIGLASANIDGLKLGLPVADAVYNTTGHIASIESQNIEVGTPDFHVTTVRGELSPTSPVVSWNLASSTNLPTVNSQLIGAKALYDTLVTPRFGNEYLYYSQLIQQTFSGGLITNLTRKTPYKEFGVGDRMYYASPFAIGPQDDFVVAIDNDVVSKRFPVNMFRTLKPTNLTYGIQNSFQDADATPAQTIGKGFGLNYDFNDFAVYMAARIKTHNTDASKRILWRYFRLGPDGNNAQVNYMLPIKPNATVGVLTVDSTEKTTDISITLGSGPLKTGAKIKPSTKIGVCAETVINGIAKVAIVLGYSVASAMRATNVTTLTLTLPPGITNHGLIVGGSIFFKTTSASFTTKLYQITAVTATTIEFADFASNVGATPNAGTVSYDDAEVILSSVSPAIVIGDYFRVDDPSGLPSIVKNQTMQITDTGNQYLIGNMDGTSFTPSTTPLWYELNSASSFKIFPSLNQTATQIVTAVNVLYNAPNSVIPIWGTVTGTGTGIINQSSSNESGIYPTWFPLKDGVNYVATTINPLIVTTDYQFIFKNPIEASLVANSDWQNEVIKIAPITTRNIVEWLNTATVTGLFTAAEVKPSDQARRVQIASLTAGSTGFVQVQGGSANIWTAPVSGTSANVANAYALTTIPKSKSIGFFADSWVAINNTNSMPKNLFATNTILLTVTANGVFTFDTIAHGGTKVWDFVNTPSTNTVVHIEKQSNFVSYVDTGLGTSLINLSGVNEGDYVRIIAPAIPSPGVHQITSVNTGIYKIVRVALPTIDNPNATFWIENPNVSEDIPSEADIQFIKSNSIMPGDILYIGTDLWGSQNKGQYVVTNVGAVAGIPFSNFYTFQVDVSTQALMPTINNLPLGVQQTLVQVIEAQPARYIKKIIGISPNIGDPNSINLKFDSSIGYREISAAAGSIVSALDKLNFSNNISQGIDGYKYSTGLLGEVNRVIYGDPQNPSIYPGVVAAGTQVDIEGPLVKRILMSLSLRIKSGFSTTDISERVKTIVASTINQSLMGQSIAISSIVAVVSRVIGVISVAVISPLFNTTHDLIPLQPFEKALVLNLDDIFVIFVGE